ncbi:MAG: hypothetical protein KAW88_02750, partial [Candidatus Cloacimonetes bacterium]|nr:hypothetical protein [Candidatus Cloacimonadota bacterium]
MKKLMIITALVICTILSAQNAVWENPLPIVLGDNIELQLPNIKTSDGNTIFFWSKTELEGRIMYATKLNEMGEYQWIEEKKVVLEHVPALILMEIIEIENNDYVLHFGHIDFKNGPYDNIYNIMDNDGNMLWNDSFSLLDHNDELYPVSQFKDIVSGFNILCHNQDIDESKILHFDLNGNYTETDVSNYSYANKTTFQFINYNNFYYLLYLEGWDLTFAKLNNNFEPINTSVISLNVVVYGNDTIHFYPHENEFYLLVRINETACKISESGDLIWTYNLNNSYNKLKSGVTENGDLFILEKNNSDQVKYYLINSNGTLAVEQIILQGEVIDSYNFHASYNGEDKIHVIAVSYNNSIFSYYAQSIDLDGVMTYPISGLFLGDQSENMALVLTSYSNTFSYLSLELNEENNTDITISTYNDFGNQIIPEDQTILETSFVSRSWKVCSQYIEDEDCVMVAFVSNRGDYWDGEVYIQKIDQSGNLLYEEEGRYLNTYYIHDDISDVFINEDGFVFIVYEILDNLQILKCDVYDRWGGFVRTYILDSGIYIYFYTYHHHTIDGTIVGWRSSSNVKILKINENEMLWDDPISITFPTSNGLHSYVTENYLYCYYFESPGYARFLYKFEDDGFISPGWLNGLYLNSIENISGIACMNQANDCLYFISQNPEGEIQLFAIDNQQQVFLDDLNITIPFNSGSCDLYVDEDIYLSSCDTLQQCIKVQKFDLAGNSIWSNNVMNLDPNNNNGIVLKPSSANSISIVSTLTDNFRFASFDLDGNVVTPPNGVIIVDGRGEKRIINTHEMDNSQFLVTWTDQCVENILDGDAMQYN